MAINYYVRLQVKYAPAALLWYCYFAIKRTVVASIMTSFDKQTITMADVHLSNCGLEGT